MKGNVDWKDLHTKLKKVYEQMDELERKKQERTYRMIRPEEIGRTTEDTDKRKRDENGCTGMDCRQCDHEHGKQPEGSTKGEGNARTQRIRRRDRARY